ncbi:MAG TPA: hypothetical protein VF792_09315 [Ktedonobacterales bacterium]
MTARIPQSQADEAAARAAAFWPEFGRRWPWTRAPQIAQVYQLAGEQTVALLRILPAIQWSNQSEWYRRDIRDTPALLALTPEAMRVEASKFAQGGTPAAIEGKQVLSLMYPVQDEDTLDGQPSVARTLLASTARDTPLYAAQLTHEILNCFCCTEWDGQTLRCGVRRTMSPAQAWAAESGAALNDALLDAILVNILPAIGGGSVDDLFASAQGPYWRIVRTLAVRLRGVPALAALFSGASDAQQRFEQGLAVALDTPDAATKLDQLIASHNWAAVRDLLGDDA